MRNLRILFFIMTWIIFVLLHSLSLAACHYVRPPGGDYGNEDGTDWNNAYDGLPTTLVRGDVYYVAAGVYNNGWYLDDPESGTSVITIKKANASECASVQGWLSEFETGQVVVYNGSDTTYGAAITITRGYYIIDGVTGTGTSGYGIKLRYAHLNQDNTGILIRDNAVSSLTVRHVEFDMPGSSYNYAQWGIYRVSGSFSNAHVDHCYAHNFNVFMKDDGGGGTIIENCYFKNQWSSSNHHGELISIVCTDGLIFRYNIVENAVNGTGGIIVLGDYETYECSVDDVEIYGNVFFDCSGGGNGIIGTGSSYCSLGAKNWKIYNNTIVDSGSVFVYFPMRECAAGGEPASNFLIKNNLIFNSSAYIDANSATVDHNYFNSETSVGPDGKGTNQVNSTQTSAQTFVDYENDRFELKSGSDAIDTGVDLGTPYNIDILSVSRPQGSAWDIGAYEYVWGNFLGISFSGGISTQ